MSINMVLKQHPPYHDDGKDFLNNKAFVVSTPNVRQYGIEATLPQSSSSSWAILLEQHDIPMKARRKGSALDTFCIVQRLNRRFKYYYYPFLVVS
eukprot:scaffold1434_cov133-Chaetoceros_neogracile.AAC.4